MKMKFYISHSEHSYLETETAYLVYPKQYLGNQHTYQFRPFINGGDDSGNFDFNGTVHYFASTYPDWILL